MLLAISAAYRHHALHGSVGTSVTFLVLPARGNEVARS